MSQVNCLYEILNLKSSYLTLLFGGFLMLEYVHNLNFDNISF